MGEFLPISSSGHLALYKYFFSAKDAPLLFDILLHVATLASLILVFRKKIGSLIASFFRFVFFKKKETDKGNLNLIAIILIATVVTGIVGIALKDIVKHLKVTALPIGFLFTSLLLLVSSKMKLKQKPNILRIAAILGIFQGIAVFPGISRSGTTISILLMLGFLQEEVGEISFILSIPAILASLLLELISSYKEIQNIGLVPILLGMVSAFVVGVLFLSLLLRVIKSGKIKGFAYYLLPLSLGLSIYFYFFA